MLRVVTGRFHPHLESSLVDHIRQAKAGDPVAPLAILVPSSQLIDRLRRLLAIEHNLSLLNVHLLTFHQLALRLTDEAREQAEAAPAVRMADELLFEQLVRHLARSGLPGLTGLEHIGYSSGTWSALWSTVRDLKDAGVDPVSALRGLEEGYFERDESHWLEALFSLYGAVKQAGAMLRVGTADDLAESLLPSVPVSRFVSTLSQAFYYGFYDLTQVQLSFFDALSKTVPTTLFFPLESHRAFRFAQRFFDRYIQPLIPAPDQLVRLADHGMGAVHRPAVEVRSVVGVDEELASVCRHILDLVETHGYRFDDIGVVARTLDPYGPAVRAVFERHRIPLRCTAGRPLMHEPLCKTWLQLASLPINHYDRTAMLDVVTSPLYRSDLLSGAGARLRPDLWKLTVSALHITRGREEWARLELAGRGGGETAGHMRVGPVAVPPEVVELFSLVVSELIAATAALPARGTMEQLVSSFRELAARHVSRPDLGDEASAAQRLTPVWEALDRVLTALTDLEVIGADLTWAEFVELLIHAVDRTTVQPQLDDHGGVAVLDVMAARGLPFKALFVLGLNDGVFPRYIREDPFLRDRHRRVLDETLGFKIDEKLAGYDEEAILLALVRQAATDRLVISYQRADEHGRVLVASPYVTDILSLCGIVDEPPVDAVPRRLTDRVARRPTLRTFVPPEELALWMAMDGQDAAPLLAAIGRDPELFRHGMDALRHMEDQRPAVAAYDGMTGSLDAHWSALMQRGLAPTPLERYAHCPFQYFAADVLKLKPVRGSIGQGVDASVLGTVCHAALRRCYERLIPMGWPAEPVTDDSVAWCIHSAVEEAAAEHEGRHSTGHYLIWELAKEGLAALLAAAVESDEAAHAEDGFSPVACELGAHGRLPPLTPDGTPMLIQGRVDRIDRHPESGGVRIVDYKYKTGSASKTEDRNLLQAAVRGSRLQPPLYSCLELPGHPAPTEVQLVFLAPHWPTPIVRSTFASSVWQSNYGRQLHTTLKTLIDGIRAGQFFILPNGYCDTCEFRVSCRRDHTPTWWRAYRAPEAKGLKALRSQKVKDE